MKHLKLFFVLFAMFALGVGNAWAEEVTYVFTSKDWAAKIGSTAANWTSNKAGAGFSNNGIQVTTAATGANGTSPISYNNISQIVVTYNTNTSKGKGTLSVKIGDNAVTTNNWQYSGSANGTSANFTSTFDYSSPQSGKVTLTANTTTNSIYIVSIKIVTSAGSETPAPTTYTIKWHTAKGITTDVTLNEGATITKPATDPTMTGYEFMGWTASCDVASDGAGFTAIENFGTADSDKDYYAVFAVATTTGGGGGSTEYTLVSTISEGTYLIAVDKVNSSKYNFAIGTASNGHAAVEATGVTKSNTISSVPSGAKEYILTGDNTNGYSIKCDDKYLVATAAKQSLSYSTTCSETWTFKVSGSGFHLTGKTNGSKMSSNSSTAATSIRNYASSGSFYSPLYFFKKSSGSAGTTTYSDYITTCASGIEYVDLGDAFKWSATEAEVTIDATDNVFPTLTNTHNVPVKYSSSDDAIATIADGTVTLKKEGTVTITAKYEGGISAGTGKEYKAKSVTYSLKVNKAVAQPTGTMYVKVTDAVTDGEYLIVYETGNVAFNGALPALDAVSNTIAVEINSNTIAGNTEIDAATFTIASMTDGHSIQSKSGKYIGRTSNSNGMDTGNSAIANVITFSNGAVKIAGSETTSLQYNAASGQTRFRYFATTQKAIALYKKVDPNAVVEPVFQLAAGEYYGTQSVEITCATTGAEIYYTLNGTDPTSASTKYTGAISIASTTTVKAIAVKGANSSAVVSATYTILAPLATMQAIFDKATAVGGTATPVHITMNNWVVTGVKNSNAYVTDGTKGLIIYTASHGFNVGDILSGTVACKVQLYKGSAELTELTSTTEGLTVSTGGVVTPVVVNDVTTLGGVNTGSVIKVTGPCTVNGTKYYVAGLELYNSLFAYTNPEAEFNYECTGVYVQFDATQEILPRKAEDLVKIETQQPAGIVFAVTEHTAEVGATDFVEPELTNPNSLTVTYKTSDATLATVDATTGEVTIGNKAGKVTITASFAGNEDYVEADASYYITITDPNQLEATFVAGTDKSDTKSISKKGITVEFTNGVFNRADNYRCYGKESMTISYADGNITKIVIECTANDGAEYGPGQFTTETVTYSYSGKVGTWTGEANSVTFTADKQVRMTTITVYYKQDNRADAGLAWNPATVSLTVGDAFTAPTFSNPNNLTGITFASDNEALATVTNAGVISLISGKTGTATITATFADGHADYKPAEATCVITVSPKSEKVVILAQYGDQWYALKAAYLSGKTDRLDAIPVNYVGGKLYNVAEADKASIEWSSVVEGDKVSFLNDGKYLKGKTSTTLLFEAGEDGLYQWDNTNYTMTIGTTVRSFLYNGEAFRNFAVSNAGKVVNDILYSSLPVVTAPVYATGDAYSRSTIAGKFGTICLPFGSTNFTGATFYEFVGSETGKVYLGSVTTLEAGVPYIFEASAAEVAVYGDGTTAATPGNSKGLHGTFTDETTVAAGNYILLNNELRPSDGSAKVNANRAYIVMSEVPTGVPTQMPGRRYIGMSVQGENEATGFENVVAPEGQAIKVIENGQLIIIRGGEKFNVQGQRL